MSNQFSIFNFRENQVRVEMHNNEPYFCLKDVAEILEIPRTSDLLQVKKGVVNDVPLSNQRGALDENGCKKIATLTKGGKQELTFINEPNLYRVIFRSNKTEAQAFQNWIFEEVIPAIRKTGSYTAEPQKQPESEVKYVNPNDDPVLKTVMGAMVEHAQRVKNGEMTEYQPKPKKARTPKFTRSEFELMAKMLTYAKEWANIQKMLCNAPNSSPEAQEWLQKFNNVYTSYVTNPKDGGFVLFFKPNVTDDVNEFADWLKLQSKTL